MTQEIKRKKEETYDPDNDCMKDIINPAIDGKSVTVKVNSYNQGNYVRRRLTRKFKIIAENYQRIEEEFTKPIPHLIKKGDQYCVVIDRIDKRRNKQVWIGEEEK